MFFLLGEILCEKKYEHFFILLVKSFLEKKLTKKKNRHRFQTLSAEVLPIN